MEDFVRFLKLNLSPVALKLALAIIIVLSIYYHYVGDPLSLQGVVALSFLALVLSHAVTSLYRPVVTAFRKIVNYIGNTWVSCRSRDEEDG
jgi:hypothetical protein